jgi:hypothetical protein
VSPRRKRETVSKLQSQLAMSERRACQILDQPRSCQRYQAQPRSDEANLVKRMLELVRQRPRFGYRRIAYLLRVKDFARVILGYCVCGSERA